MPFASARRRLPDEGAGRPRRRGARRLVRVRARSPARRGGGSRLPERSSPSSRGRDRPALRARRWIAVRGPLRRGRADRRPASSARPSPIRCAFVEAGTERRDLAVRLSISSSRSAGLPLLAPLGARSGAARGRSQPALRHADADLDPLPLHGGRDPRARRRRGVRRRPARSGAGRGSPIARPLARRARGSSPAVGSARSRLAPRARSARSSRTRDHVVSEHDAAAARVIALVPAGAAVSATNTLGAHLSARRRIFSFPVLREARWVAVDTDAAELPRRRRRRSKSPPRSRRLRRDAALATSSAPRTASSCSTGRAAG